MDRLEALPQDSRELAFTDWQLDLPNGLKLVYDFLHAEIKPSLIILEVKSLREINEVCGRHIGDQLLMDVKGFLRLQAGDDLTLYRVSGNRFCLSSYLRAADALRAYAAGLSARLCGPWEVLSNEKKFTVSCEIVMAVIPAVYMDKSESLLNIIERAFKAAKESGQAILLYDDELDRRFKRRRQFEFSLKRCVANDMDGFSVFYQPIANPVTGIWCGLEALCRWTSPELGLISPVEFIAESERLDLIGAIGLWVLETAVMQCKAWGLDKLHLFTLDVNVSAVQMADTAVAEKIIKIITDHDYPGDKLCMEITESTQFTFNGPAMTTFNQLRAARIAIALDDFGTGYSAFNRLKEMPVDIVKIERVFVQDIENDSYLRYLFRAIAELVHTADMRVVAEGVETQEQMHILLKNGADMLQGYLFSKPLSAGELGQKLHCFTESGLDNTIMQRQKIDMAALLKTEESHILTPSLNRTMFRCIHLLLHSEDVGEAIQIVLGITGKTLNASRVYVFEGDGGAAYANTFEWRAKGIAPRQARPEGARLRDAWFDIMRRDGILIASDVSELPADIGEGLSAQGIKAVVSIPLWENKAVSGFIGLDECQEYRAWWPEEVLMLYNIALIVASVMNRLKRGAGV